MVTHPGPDCGRDHPSREGTVSAEGSSTKG